MKIISQYQNYQKYFNNIKKVFEKAKILNL